MYCIPHYDYHSHAKYDTTQCNAETRGKPIAKPSRQKIQEKHEAKEIALHAAMWTIAAKYRVTQQC